MNKNAKSVFAILLIIILSITAGLSAEFLKTQYETVCHPKKYTEFVEKYAEEYKVPEYICYSVIKCESGFDSTAVSRAGAMGLMQITPATFEYLCRLVGEDHETGMLYDPETNIRFGIFYLSVLYERFENWDVAFAAYNCGPNRVQGWIDEGKVDESGNLTEIPINETENYVKRVNKAIKKYEKLYYR